jgi:hypothetical protein
MKALQTQERSRLFEEIILKSWWTILFFLTCFFAYDQAIKRRSREEMQLQKKLSYLYTEINSELEDRQELQLQLNSQNDPTWIELILMKSLGLVPESQTKVLFMLEDT